MTRRRFNREAVAALIDALAAAAEFWPGITPEDVPHLTAAMRAAAARLDIEAFRQACAELRKEALRRLEERAQEGAARFYCASMLTGGELGDEDKGRRSQT